MEFLTKYNHAKVVSPCGKLSMTDPQFLCETDVNMILKKYRVTGVLPSNASIPRFEDVSRVGDFVDVMNRVNEAKANFASLPSDLRERFGNDVAAFYTFIGDQSNYDECVKLGLFKVVEPEESAVDVLKRIEKGVTASAAAPATTGGGSVS